MAGGHGFGGQGLSDALVILGAAGIVIPAFSRLKISPIIGFIIVGMIAGPSGLGALTGQYPWLNAITITDRAVVEPFAQFGIILLLFAIGLELSFKRLMSMRKTVFGVGSAEMLGGALLIGGGLVTIPLRIAISAWLLIRRRFVAFSAFVLTWVASEVLLSWFKVYFHRGRPPGALVETVGFSFPSGHAVAGAALAIATVLVFLPPGPRRRKWELAAVGFTFVMALSRVYLSAHWFSDVVTGVLLGTGIALGAAALVTEITNVLTERGATDVTAICALAAPEGLATLAAANLPVRVVTASVDERLNDIGYIVPGLGDAGDRQFGAV